MGMNSRRKQDELTSGLFSEGALGCSLWDLVSSWWVLHIFSLNFMYLKMYGAQVGALDFGSSVSPWLMSSFLFSDALVWHHANMNCFVSSFLLFQVTLNDRCSDWQLNYTDRTSSNVGSFAFCSRFGCCIDSHWKYPRWYWPYFDSALCDGIPRRPEVLIVGLAFTKSIVTFLKFDPSWQTSCLQNPSVSYWASWMEIHQQLQNIVRQFKFLCRIESSFLLPKSVLLNN